MDDFDSSDELKNPCYDVHGHKVLDEDNIMCSRREGATLRRVCCKPGTDILGGKTRFNVDIAEFKTMTYQREISASVGQGYMQHPGQTFEVFRSADYSDEVARPCVQVAQELPRDDKGNIIDAQRIKQLATYELVNLINRKANDVLVVRKDLRRCRKQIRT